MTGSTIYKPADPRLLQQDEVWVDKCRKVHLLEKMNPHHRASLLPFLERQARQYQNAAWFIYMAGLGSVQYPSDGVWAAQQEAEREFDLDPLEWLNRQPLVRKLREYEEQRTAVDRLATKVRNKTWPIRKRLGAK